jgi:3-phosphoshikimate 1-carboxyvinyltransferase
MVRTVPPTARLRGELRVPGDKSVTHRALILASLARGSTLLSYPLKAEDTLSTVRVLRALGASIEEEGPHFRVTGTDLKLNEPEDVLDCGNAGTLIRLMSGLLAGQNFFSVLTGDASLRRRPMDRVVEPLRRMGARIEGRREGTLAPLSIAPSHLRGTYYKLPVPSAQVKSAILLAGLFAEGETEVFEPTPTRDHTERLFDHFRLPLQVAGRSVRTHRTRGFAAKDLTIPGDFSSAAFFLVAALITPDSDLWIEGVGLNPTRTGLLRALQSMGATIDWSERGGHEPVGWIRVRSSKLRGTRIDAKEIPSMIDEIPALAAAAAWAEGETYIPNLGELRVKESDRLEAIVANLRALGVQAEAGPDWLAIQGGGVRPGRIDAFRDHRIAMAFTVAGLPVGVTVEGAEWASISYPSFWEDLERLSDGHHHH